MTLTDTPTTIDRPYWAADIDPVVQATSDLMVRHIFQNLEHHTPAQAQAIADTVRRTLADPNYTARIVARLTD